MSFEESTPKVEDTPRRFTEWLDRNYTKKATITQYYTTLTVWLRYIYGNGIVSKFIFQGFDTDTEIRKRNKENRINEIESGIERYFSEFDDRNFLNDFKGFIQWQIKEGYANQSIRGQSNRVKLFFGRQSQLYKIGDEDWAQIKRTLLPKSSRAATQDEILTKEQLKIVLQQASLHCRSLAYFLLSTGARLSAACQLKMEDIDLYADPPEVNIREKYTKGEVGGRFMWFSHEARDAIIAWHKNRKGKKMKSVNVKIGNTGA